jgi:eukaryotic-like serine/threonine-protein kinase
MEYVQGSILSQWSDAPADQRPDPSSIAKLGEAIAMATHRLHQQHTVHHDLKPANVLIRPDGAAVLLDFGLSCHAHYPDLLAEQLRKAVGSPAWIAPEQVVGVRGDPRSDVFAIGVMLYQLACNELPFGEPQTTGGLRQRLWMDPKPLKALVPSTPDWLQEVVMRCLAPKAADRYASAAHLAFDLRNPKDVVVTALGRKTKGTGFSTHFKRWIKAAGMQYEPSPKPMEQIESVPIVMVAVPHKDVTDATLYSLREAVERSLGTRPGARLACITVISSGLSSASEDASSETTVHRQYLSRLQQWAKPIDMDGHQASFHVLEAGDVAQAILDYAVGNNVSVIVMGAATHGLMTQRLLATVPIKVAMDAPCTVILVKQALPFEHLTVPVGNDGRAAQDSLELVGANV